MMFVDYTTEYDYFTISSRKEREPQFFTIPCAIESFNFKWALYDWVSNTNLILLVGYNHLRLEAPKPTSMRLLMIDRTMKRLVGILFNVLVKVESFVFLIEFIIIGYDIYFQALLFWVDPS